MNLYAAFITACFLAGVVCLVHHDKKDPRG